MDGWMGGPSLPASAWARAGEKNKPPPPPGVIGISESYVIACNYGLVSGKVKCACGSYISTGENWGGVDNSSERNF